MLFAFRAYRIWAHTHTHTKISENRDTSGSLLRLLVYVELSAVPRLGTSHKLLYLPVVFLKLKSRQQREKGVLFQVTQVPDKNPGSTYPFWPTMMQKQVQNCGGGG